MLAMFSALASLSHCLQYIIIDVQKCKGVCVCDVGGIWAYINFTSQHYLRSQYSGTYAVILLSHMHEHNRFLSTFQSKTMISKFGC